MIVTRSNFLLYVDRLKQANKYGLDTETYGLREKDRLFMVIFADESDTYLFNFHPYPGLDREYCLPREWLGGLRPILANPDSTLFIHNALFDLGMVAKEGLSVASRVHCTETGARVEKNNHFGGRAYSLDACAARLDYRKDSRVQEYILKNTLYCDIPIPGKKKLYREMYFDQVPFELMAEYAQTDAKLHRILGLHQLAEMEKIDALDPGAPSIKGVLARETRLTHTCHKITRRGICINREFIDRALAYEQGLADEAKDQFQRATGLPFSDGRTTLVQAFQALGEKYPTTARGNPSFTEEVLEGMTTPVAAMVNQIRKHQKKCSTYYSSFLYYADAHDILRADMRQAGTESGRFSYREPNLQNMPKEDGPEDAQKPFLVRASFIPREDYCFVAIDYRQQEFRLMLDYAGEKQLIREINNGADVHTATAELLGIPRNFAKTINFGLLYGMGPEKLAHALGIRLKEAQALRSLYFSKLPRVESFIRQVSSRGAARGYVWNWAGRRCHIARRDWSYILPNHIIQGGGADVIKEAMNRLDERLAGFKSGMLLQVHDELLFEVHKEELEIVPSLATIMDSVYEPRNGMRLTCSVAHSFKSYGFTDKMEGFPA